MRTHGYSRIEGGPEGLIGEDTIKCQHCQRIGFVQRRGMVLWPQLSSVAQEQYTCRQCYVPICPSCANKPCRHFEKWLEQVEASAGASRLHLERMEERAWQCRSR
jgi:hypothetical protein